eukprot:15354484-Ditylum_brightwellii.AAC.1
MFQKGDEISFHSGMYEGKIGWTNKERKVVGNSIPVIVDMGDGVIKNAIVSVWSVTKRHPTKPATFVQALIAQKPDVDKLIMILAKKISLYGGTKSGPHLQGILDHIRDEIERADNICKMISEESVQFDN